MINLNNDQNDSKPVDLEKKQLVMEFERVYNTWITVGLGGLVGGLYVIKTLSTQYDSLTTTIYGLIIVLGSIATILFAYWSFNKNLKKIESKHHKKSLINLTIMITVFLIINGILILFFIFNSFKT